MENKLDQYEDICKPQFEHINMKLDKIIGHFEGNGQPGINIRLDRIEQNEDRRKWTVRAIVGTLLGVIGAILYDLLHK